ncbi:MAG: hypothetical protein ABIP75_17845 [Pyrinomonadaceae bacterium]
MKFIAYLPKVASVLLLTFLFASLALAQRPGGGPPGGGPGGPGPGGPPQGPGGPPRGPGGPPRQFGGDPEGPRRNGPPRPGDRRPPEAQLDFAAAEMLGNRQVVKNAPYSAEAVTEMTQILANGTRISHKTTASVARDSQGRTRRELNLESIGPFVVNDDGPPLVLINDPAAKSHYWLNADDRSARKIIEPKNPPPGRVDGRDEGFAQGKVENLGTQMIEGVSAEGIRSTITIPAGEIGNDRPLEIVSERWYSAELQTVVMSKHIDPRHGENVYRLTNLKRAEPDAELFRIPADYRVREEKPPPRRNGPPPAERLDDLMPQLPNNERDRP